MQYRHLQMARISFAVVGKMPCQTTTLRFSRRCKNQTAKSSQKKLQNMTINLPSYIFRAHTLILLTSFFIHFVVELLPIV